MAGIDKRTKRKINELHQEYQVREFFRYAALIFLVLLFITFLWDKVF